MSRRILIVDPAGQRPFLRERALELGAEPLVLARQGAANAAHADFVLPRVDDAAIEAIATKAGVHAVFPAVAEVFSATMAAGLRLRLPAINPHDNEALHHHAAPVLRQRGFRVAETKMISVGDDAARAVQELGTPLWVKCAGADGHARRMRLDHLDDLPLAIAKVSKYARSSRVLLQRPVRGKHLHAVGFRYGLRFAAFALFAVQFGDEMFSLPNSIVAPPGLNDGTYDAAMACLEAAGHALPPGHGPIEAELSIDREGPLLTHLRIAPEVDPLLAQILQHSERIDLYTNALRVALDLSPDESAATNIAAAASWLHIRPGVVTGVQGVEEARRQPGVAELYVPARPGHVFGHIRDKEALNEMGYAIATGPEPATALAAAQHACRSISVETTVLSQ